jgi:hypothetical protein
LNLAEPFPTSDTVSEPLFCSLYTFDELFLSLLQLHAAPAFCVVSRTVTSSAPSEAFVTPACGASTTETSVVSPEWFVSNSVVAALARRLVLLIRFVPIDDGLREPLVLIREAHDLFLHLVALARRWTLGPLKGAYGS